MPPALPVAKKTPSDENATLKAVSPLLGTENFCSQASVPQTVTLFFVPTASKVASGENARLLTDPRPARRQASLQSAVFQTIILPSCVPAAKNEESGEYCRLLIGPGLATGLGSTLIWSRLNRLRAPLLLAKAIVLPSGDKSRWVIFTS